MANEQSNTHTSKPETGVIRLNDSVGLVTHSEVLTQQTVRVINVLCHDLEKPWLGDPKVSEAFKQFIIQNKRAQLRILVKSLDLALRNGHPLVELIKKLSRIKARIIKEDILDKMPLQDMFITFDRGGIVYRDSGTGFDGFAHYDDKQTVARMNERFEEYWRYSVESPELRTFRL